jgi:hypothetical protein
LRCIDGKGVEDKSCRGQQLQRLDHGLLHKPPGRHLRKPRTPIFKVSISCAEDFVDVNMSFGAGRERILVLIGKAQSEFKIDPKKVYLVGRRERSPKFAA